MATKLLLKELDDTSYRIIHIDPDYQSLQEDPEIQNEDDRLSKVDSSTPFLKQSIAYAQLNKSIQFGDSILVTENNTIKPRWAILEMHDADRSWSAHVVYDISVRCKKEMMYHPIAVIKDRDQKGVKFGADGTLALETQKEFIVVGLPEEMQIVASLPGIMTQTDLVSRHFYFSELKTVYKDANGGVDRDELTLVSSRAYKFSKKNGFYTTGDELGAFSLSLNLTRARTINEENSEPFKFSLPEDHDNNIYSRVTSSASRQAALLLNSLAYDFSTANPPINEDNDNVIATLRTISKLVDNELFALRHVCLVWCALLVYYTNKIGLPPQFESAQYKFRSKILGMITDDACWVKTTSVDLDSETHILPRVLYRFLYKMSTIMRDSSPETLISALAKILSDELRIDDIELDMLKPHTLDGREQFLSTEFSDQANHYDKIFIGMNITSADKTVKSIHLLAQTIEKKPYYCGAYAAEIDRIAKAYATNEIACVPEYQSNVYTEYTCKHRNAGVSLNTTPQIGENDHPHPVAEYFNAGMVVILAALLRAGHTVKTVPYLQPVSTSDVNAAGKMPWPLSPAMEITFASGRKHYHNAAFVWLDYSKLYLADDNSTSDQPVNPAFFARRLLQRAKILGYLPAIALVTTTEAGEVTVERSHDASEPPIAIITVLSPRLVKVAATLYHQEISHGASYEEEDAKRATSRILSEFSGFCPTTWTHTRDGQEDDAGFCYMMERICLGMSLADAAKGLAEDKTNFRRVLANKKLFGIPE
jgi:hypothetical protein